MAYGDRRKKILAMLAIGQTAVEVAAALGVTSGYVWRVAAQAREDSAEFAAVESHDHPRRVRGRHRCPTCHLWMELMGPAGDCWVCHVRRAKKCGLCSSDKSAIGGG